MADFGDKDKDILADPKTDTENGGTLTRGDVKPNSDIYVNQ